MGESVRPAFDGDMSARVLFSADIPDTFIENIQNIRFLEKGFFIIVVDDLGKEENGKCAQEYRVVFRFANPLIEVRKELLDMTSNLLNRIAILFEPVCVKVYPVSSRSSGSVEPRNVNNSRVSSARVCPVGIS